MSRPAAVPGRVSVVLPVRNARPYIADALASVTVQDHPDWEIVVVDDGSDDGTPEVVTGLAAADPRIRLDRQPGRGIVAALNRGLGLATGEFIARMDGDDLMTPGRLSAQVAHLRAHPSVVAVGTDYELFGALVGRVRTPRTPAAARARLLFGPCMCHPAMLLRRSTLTEQLIEYRAGWDGAEDYLLESELAGVGELANLPTVGLRYRRHHQQVSSAGRDRQRELHLRIARANLAGAGCSQVTDEQLVRWLWPTEQAGTTGLSYLRSVPGLLRTGARAAGVPGLLTAVQLVRENLATLRAASRVSARRDRPAAPAATTAPS
ncbi:glycosyltransferase family 2 protein [Nakamurella leprariae]|uniref:Glycosyltransferase family 2 protein n=1 Tax=Nakamurella leprariae TaxID=2803911 RepID=A0A938YGA5_9ACTN|nr:glycosyltransferase family 2 protein [Nakamurella leprariae]MBM9468981.1 glycosyltransferase family 2 protein [Nakamurella leprariae]